MSVRERLIAAGVLVPVEQREAAIESLPCLPIDRAGREEAERLLRRPAFAFSPEIANRRALEPKRRTEKPA